MHDTLVRLWQQPNSYRTERGLLRNFLIVAVRNDALSRRRTALRRQGKIAALREAPAPFEFADPIERTRVRAAVRSLSPELRDALHCAYDRGMTHAEVAEELRVPLGTVKSRMHAALRKLASILSPEAAS